MLISEAMCEKGLHARLNTQLGIYDMGGVLEIRDLNKPATTQVIWAGNNKQDAEHRLKIEQIRIVLNQALMVD